MLFLDLDFNKDKKLVSIRDGVHEYLGSELGLEPRNKIFKVYRSPETVKVLEKELKNIPITDEHIDTDMTDIPKDKIVGLIKNSKIVEAKDDKTKSTIAIENDVTLDENMIELSNVKNQLSLGYTANVKDNETYDLEQIDIKPHHLAVVKNGRCGDVCKFEDKGMPEMDEKLKELIQKVIDKMGKIAFEAMLNKSLLDEPQKEKESKEKESKDIVTKFKDSQEFKDSIKEFGNRRADTILKATKFLDENYSYDDKDTLVIMKDVLARENAGKFEDSEVSVAFKMLKKVDNYKKFGDSKQEDWIDDAFKGDNL